MLSSHLMLEEKSVEVCWVDKLLHASALNVCRRLRIDDPSQQSTLKKLTIFLTVSFKCLMPHKHFNKLRYYFEILMSLSSHFARFFFSSARFVTISIRKTCADDVSAMCCLRLGLKRAKKTRRNNIKFLSVFSSLFLPYINLQQFT